MTRRFCLSLVVLSASLVSLQAQPSEPQKSFTNSLGMKFVWIEPGTFLMGSPKNEKGRSEIEVQHKVTLTKGFYMSTCPVTQEQWYAIIAPGYYKHVEEFDLSHPSRFQSGKNFPVDSVSWDDCQVFIKKLQKKEKRQYRLPTEAEWEYACRAGTTTPYYFGHTISTSEVNFAGGALEYNGKKGANRKKTTPVGSFPPNAWGLYDMHGNLAQWCEDRFGNYTSQSVVDPRGAPSRGARILRGGSWEEAALRCRSACRGWDSPDNRGNGTFGLRLCFSPPE